MPMETAAEDGTGDPSTASMSAAGINVRRIFILVPLDPLIRISLGGPIKDSQPRMYRRDVMKSRLGIYAGPCRRGWAGDERRRAVCDDAAFSGGENYPACKH